MTNNIEIIIITLVYINTLIIGYLLGRVNYGSGVLENASRSFLHKQTDVKNKQIIIDDKKFVTEIKTDSLEKKYETLGDTKHSVEDISSSINKLKNLKR
jgi:hypothetical protein